VLQILVSPQEEARVSKDLTLTKLNGALAANGMPGALDLSGAALRVHVRVCGWLSGEQGGPSHGPCLLCWVCAPFDGEEHAGGWKGVKDRCLSKALADDREMKAVMLTSPCLVPILPRPSFPSQHPPLSAWPVSATAQQHRYRRQSHPPRTCSLSCGWSCSRCSSSLSDGGWTYETSTHRLKYFAALLDRESR